jgi:hypothetical protein
MATLATRRAHRMARASKGEGRPYTRKSDGLSVVVVRDADGKRKYLYATTRDAVIERRGDRASR